jgi:hypothetical protein
MLNVFGCSEKKVTECVDETRQGLSFWVNWPVPCWRGKKRRKK